MKLIFVLILWLVAVTSAVAQPKNAATDGLSSFDSLLIKKLGDLFYQGSSYDVASAERKKKFDQDKKSILPELALIRQGLTNYYLLSGKFPSNLFPKTALDDTSRLKAVDTMLVHPKADLEGRKGLLWTKAGWVFLKRGNQLQNDTCMTFAFSSDSSLIALATSTKLIIRQVYTGQAVGKGMPLTKLSQPVYAFPAHQPYLFVVDQQNPSVLKQIGPGDAEKTFSLSKSFAQQGYRVDQIRPDDGLVVARRVEKGKTSISVWNFKQQKEQSADILPYAVSHVRLENLQSDSLLLAVYRANVQGYQLRIKQAGQLGNYTDLIPRVVREYRLDAQDRLVALQDDSLLVMVDLQTAKPVSTAIARNARYFDWQGNTIVYWQRRDPQNPNQWGLHTYTIGTTPKPAVGTASKFWYDTDLRRDVPRITLRDDAVYFDDRSNNTYNKVAMSRLSEK